MNNKRLQQLADEWWDELEESQKEFYLSKWILEKYKELLDEVKEKMSK